MIDFVINSILLRWVSDVFYFEEQVQGGPQIAPRRPASKGLFTIIVTFNFSMSSTRSAFAESAAVLVAFLEDGMKNG